ncbi:alpha/beta hydrolase [Acinetobacter nectaris]|nr:alpha/beta hydrolase [Acinetobacter nectaris]
MWKSKLKSTKDRILSLYLTAAKERLDEFRFYDVASHHLNRLTSREHFTLNADLSYGEHVRQKLDLYKAKNPRLDEPLIVFVHGGTWAHGKKEDYLFVGESFAREGFNVAVINYRLAPEHKFPDYVNDLVIALNYLEKEKQGLNLSTENIILMGHSAGGFNIMSAIYSPYESALVCKHQVKMVIGLAGPYHFKYMGDANLEQAFDLSLDYKEVMPYYFVEKNDIHHVLLLASKDFLVAKSNTLDMHDKLMEVGNISIIKTVPYTGHITLVGSLSSYTSRMFATKAEILKEINKCLGEA